MRSRAELRRASEWLLRGALVALLAVALWRTLREPVGVRVTRAVAASALGGELGPLLAAPDVSALDVGMDVTPAPVDREALVALRRAGVAVRWSGTVPPLAMEAVRVREPEARARVLVTAGGSARLSLADSA